LSGKARLALPYPSVPPDIPGFELKRVNCPQEFSLYILLVIRGAKFLGARLMLAVSISNFFLLFLF